MTKPDGDLIELDELNDLLRAREGPARPQPYRRRRGGLLLAAIAVSLAAAGLVAVAVIRSGVGEKAQPTTTANGGTSSGGSSAASCAAVVEWEGTTYYGTGGLPKAISLAGPLGEGTVPSCGDTAPGSPSPARSVALARVAGLPPEMAIAVAGETDTLYVAPQFFPQIPGTALHDLIYGPNRDVPDERVGEEGCPVSTRATIDGTVVSSGFGTLRVDAADPDAELPGDNPIFTYARTTITREGASTPYAEPGDSVQASVLVCRNPDDPHYLTLVATRVEITPG
jgi:Family of unknown function (DUF6281)